MGFRDFRRTFSNPPPPHPGASYRVICEGMPLCLTLGSLRFTRQKIMKSVVWKCALWLCVVAWPPGLWAAAPLATATIVDGEVLLVRGASRLQLAEGVRLAKDDIVENTAKGRLVRIEFSDGLIVDLGPESRALLAPKLMGDRARFASRLHLLRGVAKVTVPKPLPPAAAAFSSPGFDVTGVARSAVFIVQAGEAFAFAESGEVVLSERSRGRAAGSTSLKNGEFYAHVGDSKPTVTTRPTPAFIQRLPRAFLDTLPARAALFSSRGVEPKLLGEISFADAQDWIDAESLRAQFAARWRALAQYPAFREGVAANMSAHPEWDRILYPEKYLPKPASAPTSAAAAGQGKKP